MIRILIRGPLPNAYYDLEGVDFTFSTDANGVYQESMIYDSVTGTPILFHGTENGTEIYAVILDTRAETAELVSMGTIQGYQSVAMYAGSFEGEITAQAEQLLGEIEAQDQQILLTTAEEAPAQGSTNMAAGVEPTEDKSVVTVTLRADEAVGSGMAEIELGEGLTLPGLGEPASAVLLHRGRRRHPLCICPSRPIGGRQRHRGPAAGLRRRGYGGDGPRDRAQR